MDESLIWALQEAQKALRNKDTPLASRYIEKALERITCSRCKQPLTDDKPYSPYYKGFRHDSCEYVKGSWPTTT